MIEVEALTKRFGAHTAVDALSFTVAPGRVGSITVGVRANRASREPLTGKTCVTGSRAKL